MAIDLPVILISRLWAAFFYNYKNYEGITSDGILLI